MDQLDSEEQERVQSAAKERRNLEDVFSEKDEGVSSVKIRTLLRVSGRECRVEHSLVLGINFLRDGRLKAYFGRFDASW